MGLNLEFKDRGNLLHASAPISDGWASHPRGFSFYDDESLEIFGVTLVVKMWVRNTRTASEKVYSPPPDSFMCASGWHFIEADGTAHWWLTVRVCESERRPNPEIFGNWTQQQNQKFVRDFYVSGRYEHRLQLMLTPPRIDGPTVTLPSLKCPLVPGGLPSLGKRR